MQVKEIRNIETQELLGYLLDNNLSVPLDPNNRHYQEVQDWLKENTPEPAYTEQQLLDFKSAQLKQAKEFAKKNIVVTTSSGNKFNGDADSRNNMLSAIQASEIFNQTETQWKLADNNIIMISLTELKEALALSIQECGRIILAQSISEL